MRDRYYNRATKPRGLCLCEISTYIYIFYVLSIAELFFLVGISLHGKIWLQIIYLHLYNTKRGKNESLNAIRILFSSVANQLL